MSPPSDSLSPESAKIHSPSAHRKGYLRTVSTRPLLLITLLFLGLVAGALAQVGPFGQPKEDKRFSDFTLDEAIGGTGITDLKPDEIAAAIRPYQTLPEDLQERVTNLVNQLEADAFRDREDIRAQLLAIAQTESAADSVFREFQTKALPPESRQHLHWLLNQHSGDPIMPLRGLLEWTRLEKPAGILSHLERIHPANLDRALKDQFLLCADLARSDDIPRLNAWVESPRKILRHAAIRGFLAVDPKAHANEFLHLLKDNDPHLRLEAALALGKASRPECLAPLQALLDEDDFHIRARAGYALNQLAGKWLGFTGGDKAERERATKAMRALTTTSLNFPLTLPHSVTGAPGSGRRIVTAGGNDATIRIFGADGKLAIEKKTPYHFIGDVIPMGDGKYFLTVTERFGIHRNLLWDEAQPDRMKKIGRPGHSYPCPNIISDGHILLCGDGLSELDETFKKIRHHPLPETGRMAWKTVHGTTLVALHQRVNEYDPSGKLVWSKPFTDDFVVCCQGLENGNVLIVLEESNRLVEFNHDGDIVWEWSPDDARLAITLWDTTRLDNGNHLIKTRSAALELSPGGRVLWFKRFGNAGQVRKAK